MFPVATLLAILLAWKFLGDSLLALSLFYLACLVCLLAGMFRQSLYGQGTTGFVAYTLVMAFTLFVAPADMRDATRTTADYSFWKTVIRYLFLFLDYSFLALLIYGIIRRSRHKKPASVACLVALLLLFGLRHVAIAEFNEREQLLEPLVAARTPLNEVLMEAGIFNLYRRGTSEWTNVIAYYQRGSHWNKYIARKIESAHTMGHSSTIDMQTWIFLDEHDRLVSFELGSQ